MGAHDLGDLVKIAILDVPPVFAKMNRDAVGTRFFGSHHCLGRPRIDGSASLAKRRDMVDIDAKIKRGGIHAAILDHS